MVCEIRACGISFLACSASMMEICVLRYPLQVTPIAVYTAISFGPTAPLSMSAGVIPIAAPTAPSAVIGNAMAAPSLNPNRRFVTGAIRFPSFGRTATPSYAAPV